MYTFSITMIIIASILLILAVLVQSPKSGMAANFGAANQTMGVRQTTDFLEKFTWAMIAAIVFFTLLSVVGLPEKKINDDKTGSAEVAAAVDNTFAQAADADTEVDAQKNFSEEDEPNGEPTPEAPTETPAETPAETVAESTPDPVTE